MFCLCLIVASKECKNIPPLPHGMDSKDIFISGSDDSADSQSESDSDCTASDSYSSASTASDSTASYSLDEGSDTGNLLVGEGEVVGLHYSKLSVEDASSASDSVSNPPPARNTLADNSSCFDTDREAQVSDHSVSEAGCSDERCIPGIGGEMVYNCSMMLFEYLRFSLHSRLALYFLELFTCFEICNLS